MRAGSLDQIITIERKTVPERQDSFGAAIEVWLPRFVNIRASFEALGSSEFPTFEKRFSETTARFRLRYIAGIDSNLDRIRWIQDRSTSPIIITTWDIYPPLPVKGKALRETLIEVREQVEEREIG